MATHEYITFIVHHCKKKVKICHNFNKSASVYSEMLSFRCFDFLFKTKKKKKMYQSFSMDSMCGRFCSIECEDLKRKGLKDRILTMIVIIITKIGINRTGKHNLH